VRVLTNTLAGNGVLAVKGRDIHSSKKKKGRKKLKISKADEKDHRSLSTPPPVIRKRESENLCVELREIFSCEEVGEPVRGEPRAGGKDEYARENSAAADGAKGFEEKKGSWRKEEGSFWDFGGGRGNRVVWRRRGETLAMLADSRDRPEKVMVRREPSLDLGS